MQIPIPLPDLHLSQTPLRESQSVTPVTAVAGVPELAETLSPHVALQWAQPVLSAQGSGVARSADHTEAFASKTAPTPVPPASPNSHGPAALTQWSLPGQVLTQLLKQTQSSASFSKPTPWPEPTSDEQVPADTAATMPRADAVLQAIQKLRTALSSAEVFAARQLANQWFGPERNDPDGQASAQAQRWVQALSPEHPAAQQATHMLMTGQMVWQGELLPGLPMRIHREDSWRENAPGSGRLEKGAALSLEIDLPQLGHLKVTGQQWGDQLDVIVRIPRQGNALLRNAWPELQKRLTELCPGRLATHWQETE